MPNKSQTITWTPANLKTLQDYLHQGLSFTAIAARMNTTKNAVNSAAARHLNWRDPARNPAGVKLTDEEIERRAIARRLNNMSPLPAGSKLTTSLIALPSEKLGLKF